MLSIALTKGRLEKQSVAMFEQCGYGIEELKDKGRQLVFQHIAALEAVQGRGPDNNGQKQKAGVANHVNDKKDADKVKKRLKNISHMPLTSLAAS